MLTVIIIEDEEKICNMIATFIDWNKLGYHIIATAGDGITGKKIIKELQPDVVITDIRMPGCDGIEMITDLKSSFPKMEMIIISGYKNFEYAHQAIKLGVHYFLLKPILENELIETLIQIRAEHTNKLTQQDTLQHMQDRIKSQNNILRNSFLKLLCDKKNHFFCSSIGDINAKYSTCFSQGFFCVFIVRCSKKYNNDYSDSEDILTNIVSLIEQIYRPNVHEVISIINDYGIVTTLNYSKLHSDTIKHLHCHFWKNASQRAEALGPYSVYLGLGKTQQQICTLHESFSSAVTSLRSRVFAGNEPILFYKDPLKTSEDTTDIISANIYGQLLDHIKAHNDGLIEHWFSKLTDILISPSTLTLSSLYSICYHILEIIINLLKNTEHSELDTIVFEFEIDSLNATSIPRIVSILQKYIILLVKKYYEEENLGNNYIRQAIRYIEKNYTLPIKLEDVAGHVHLNTTYFSEMFKSERGVTFTDFLLHIRLEHAKVLLRDTDYGIAQIASEVGYSDAKYFSKVFNKTIGIKPTSYRKLYR